MGDIQYGMVINTNRCFGCQTCVVGCKVNNEIPLEAYWNRIESLDGDVLYQATGTFPNVRMRFRAALCNHCLEPLCVKNCPTAAMHKSAETGIVSVDEELCIGCESCVKACPYSMPVLNQDRGISSKCNFCATRVQDGKQPYCVESCPGQARIFGNLNDPESAVSKLIAEHGAKPWNPEAGTSPCVYYY